MAISSVVPAGWQARAAALQIAMIGVGLCLILLLRPRGLLGERRTVSRHLLRLTGGTSSIVKPASDGAKND
jgi:branched-chain amino acid transport system permease protein